MPILTLEGVVKHGQITFTPSLFLPEHTKVYVVIPDLQVEHRARLLSPRLHHPAQVSDFEMAVTQEPDDADV